MAGINSVHGTDSSDQAAVVSGKVEIGQAERSSILKAVRAGAMAITLAVALLSGCKKDEPAGSTRQNADASITANSGNISGLNNADVGGCMGVDQGACAGVDAASAPTSSVDVDAK